MTGGEDVPGAPVGSLGADRGGWSPVEVAAAFWEALYRRDWTDVASFFGPESIYFDVPTGPSTAAQGPDDIVTRLRLGLDGLEPVAALVRLRAHPEAGALLRGTDAWLHQPPGRVAVDVAALLAPYRGGAA